MPKQRDRQRDVAHCSFCTKSQEQAFTLIGGPGGIFICDECVALCNEIIAERRAHQRPPSSPTTPTEQV
jgi:ATP-dependent Clp protease ATP-binding subunit ClpX